MSQKDFPKGPQPSSRKPPSAGRFHGMTPQHSPNLPRMVSVDRLYFQPGNGQPTLRESKTTRFLAVGTSPQEIELEVGEQWTRILTVSPDTPEGEQRNPSAVVLFVENHGDGERQVYPTEEEKSAELASVLEIGVAPENGPPLPFALVRVGESARYEPGPQIRVTMLRCQRGTAKVRLTILSPS